MRVCSGEEKVDQNRKNKEEKKNGVATKKKRSMWDKKRKERRNKRARKRGKKELKKRTKMEGLAAAGGHEDER